MELRELLRIQRISDHRDSSGGDSWHAGLVVAATCLSAISLAGCLAAGLSSKPGAYKVISGRISAAHREIHATWVRPLQERHPGYVVMFSTGDYGWFGTSAVVFRHLAEERYTLVGLSTPEILAPIIRSGERVSTTQAALRLKELYAQANRHVGLPETTPIVLVGFSHGASVVAFTAVHPELQGRIRGAVAIGLTREADCLHVPESERGHGIQVDENGRLQLYPALKLLGSTRIAVIQWPVPLKTTLPSSSFASTMWMPSIESWRR